MKAATLRMLVGVTTPLILGGSVRAGFTGISTVSKPNEFGLLVVNVYAEFDRPGEDAMRSVVGTANNPLLIQVIGGTFYNHAFGSDHAPSELGVDTFPSLAFDTFLTIGIKVAFPHLPDALVITPGFPAGITGTQLFTTVSGWAITPIDPQGDPFNPNYAGGNGQVLIGQFSTADGTGFHGTMLVGIITNGIVGQAVVSFFHVPGPGALWLLGAAGLFGSRRRRSRWSMTRLRPNCPAGSAGQRCRPNSHR